MQKDLFDLGIPFVAGGVVFLLAALTTGLVTPTNAARSDVAMARIDERAAVCQQAATAALSEVAQPADFSGIEGRQRRDSFARDFVMPSGDDRTDRLVMEECSKRLDT